MTTLRQRCLAIDLLVLDVDGVLTTGGIVHGTGGLELKAFHVRDGSALKAWRDAGKKAAVITGRSSPVVNVRAAEIGIATVVQGVGDKLAAFRRVLQELGTRAEQACFVGDDTPDLPALRESGLAVAVADACAETRMAAHYVTRCAGGNAAVREVIELILRCQGTWREGTKDAAERRENGPGARA